MGAEEYYLTRSSLKVVVTTNIAHEYKFREYRGNTSEHQRILSEKRCSDYSCDDFVCLVCDKALFALHRYLVTLKVPSEYFRW